MVLSFFQGAHFYQNVEMLIYRQFINFLYKINCIACNQKCNFCPLGKSCRYYWCNGSNFSGYPGIFIRNNIFTKTIFRQGENLELLFYFIGDNIRYRQYVNIFFSQYLNENICKQYFHLNTIELDNQENEDIYLDSLTFKTLIEDDNFIDAYNNMLTYYNDNYHTQFEKLEKIDYKCFKHKAISLNTVHLKTKNIFLKGKIYTVKFSKPIKIPGCIKEIGIGKYNFLGGGIFETENNVI